MQQKQKLRNRKQCEHKVYECFCSKRYNSYAGLYLHLKSKHEDAFSLYKNMKLSKLLTTEVSNQAQNIFKLKSPQADRKKINESQMQKSQIQKVIHHKEQQSLRLQQNQPGSMRYNNDSMPYILSRDGNIIKPQNPTLMDCNSLFQANSILTDPKTTHLPFTQLPPQYQLYHSNYLSTLYTQQMQSTQQIQYQHPCSIPYQYFPFLNLLAPPQINQGINLYFDPTNIRFIHEKNKSFHPQQFNSSIKSLSDINENHHKPTFSHQSLQDNFQSQKNNFSQ